MLDNWGIYDALYEKSNIFFDEYERDGESLLDKTQHLQKCDVISAASAVLHAGTTIGLEASYFNPPVIYLNPLDINYGISLGNPNHIFRSWEQYHLQKYYKVMGQSAVVNSIDELEGVLRQIVKGDGDFQGYKEKLNTYSNLMSMGEFTQRFF